LGRHAGQSTNRQHQSDILFRPTQISQVKGQERAKAHLDIGEEEVCQVEAAPALVGYLPIQSLAPLPVRRHQTA
jgi:hypothetical protein